MVSRCKRKSILDFHTRPFRARLPHATTSRFLRSRLDLALAGGPIFSMAEVGPIDAADLHIKPGKVIVADLSFLQETTGRNVDLVVGASEIAAEALEIDADHRRLRFVTSGKAQPSTWRIPLHLAGVNRMMVGLEVGGIETRPVDVGYGRGQQPSPFGGRFSAGLAIHLRRWDRCCRGWSRRYRGLSFDQTSKRPDWRRRDSRSACNRRTGGGTASPPQAGRLG